VARKIKQDSDDVTELRGRHSGRRTGDSQPFPGQTLHKTKCRNQFSGRQKNRGFSPADWKKFNP